MTDKPQTPDLTIAPMAPDYFTGPIHSGIEKLAAFTKSGAKK